MSEQFDLMGSGYEGTLLSHPQIRREEVEHILNEIKPQPGQAVLDFAAGSGFLTLELAARVRPTGRVTAVDSSAVMLSLLRAKRGASDFVECVQTADPSLAELPTTGFDRITSLGGFHHVEDQVATMHALVRLLRPGGRALVLDFADQSPAQEHFDGLVHEHNPTGHNALFLSRSRAVNLARFAGCFLAKAESKRFAWQFADADDMGAFFVKHHGLRCGVAEARDRSLATFRPDTIPGKPVVIILDYIQLLFDKPA